MNAADFFNHNNVRYDLHISLVALAKHQSIQNTHSLSIISQYLYDENLATDKQKTQWLQQQIEKIKPDFPSTTVKAYLYLSLLGFIPEKEKYNTYCLNPSDWNNSTYVFLKVDLMQQCINIAKQYNFESPTRLITDLANINQQKEEILPEIKKLMVLYTTQEL